MSLFQGKISEVKQRNVLHLFGESEEKIEAEREHEEYPDWSEDVSVVSESESQGEMESEDTDVGVSVDPVPSTSHATGKFYNPARSRCPLRAKRVPASRGTRDVWGTSAHALVARGSTRGRGGCRARKRAGSSPEDPPPVVTYKSYDDEDEGNPCDQFPPSPFTPARPPGIQFEQPLLRGRIHTATEFFKLFFTEELPNDIVKHTDNYAVHRCGIRQYIKDKPIKRGIKLCVVSGSSDGCTVDLNISIRKDVAREIRKFELGHDV